MNKTDRRNLDMMLFGTRYKYSRLKKLSPDIILHHYCNRIVKNISSYNVKSTNPLSILKNTFKHSRSVVKTVTNLKTLFRLANRRTWTCNFLNKLKQLFDKDISSVLLFAKRKRVF